MRQKRSAILEVVKALRWLRNKAGSLRWSITLKLATIKSLFIQSKGFAMKNQNFAACFQSFIQNMMASPMKRGEWFLQLMIEKRDQRLSKKIY